LGFRERPARILLTILRHFYSGHCQASGCAGKPLDFALASVMIRLPFASMAKS
jgi:hypothetical protein